ncbi:MAG: 2-C-methyl-D-erythritol 2,4-cyclodiphosphate synthase [Coprobacillus sp.]|nr:2-C-methyl-D-erythritol 2,4-cyclodiphosphate synthase [Coprobacillus sp.]
MTKVGHGFDIHKLVRGRPLLLGGVVIPYKKGELAHSDGDVVLHALVDAILGALHKGTIGDFFPESDDQYKNASSSLFVEKAVSLLKEEKATINNVDITIQLEEPTLKPYVEAIESSLHKLLSSVLVSSGTISVKAGTCEGMGDIGKHKAVSASASLLLNID